MKKLLLLISILLLAGCAGNKAAVKVTWHEPTEGSKVNRYILQMKTDSEGWDKAYNVGPIPMWVGDLPRSHRYYFRVIGVDSLNRAGPTSPVSDVLLLLPK